MVVANWQHINSTFMHALARLVFFILFFAVGSLDAPPGLAALSSPPVPRNKPEPPDAFLRSEEGRAYLKAFEMAAKGQLVDALTALPPRTDPLIRDLVHWSALINGGQLPFQQAKTFQEAHADWPLPGTLRRRVEEAIDQKTPDAAILAWFDRHSPRTGAGHLHYAQALFRAGRESDAIRELKAGWRTASLSSPQERLILSRYGRHLDNADHIERADRLLWQRARQQAHRLLPLLPDDHKALVKARSALMAFAYNVDAAITAVPARLRDNAGLVYDRAYWRRIKGKHKGAETLLLEASVDGREIGRPDRWWRERHFQARRALREGRIDAAYRLAAEHALLDGLADDNGDVDEAAFDLPRLTRAQIADAEWLAGWIALRFQNRPAVAMAHFQAMYGVVSFPVSLARGAYWSARAAEDMKDPALARRWYEEAARYPTSFYGQLALDRLDDDLTALAGTDIAPTPEERASFEEKDMVKAAQFLSKLGEDKLLSHIIRHLVMTAQSRSEMVLAAELGSILERPNIGVIAAKTAIQDGAYLVDTGYPVIAMGTTPPQQQSLVLSIARQESQFDPKAVSHVGALGLMQLMPATANRLARQLSRPYSKERLLSDPAYNLELGSTYFSQLMQRFDSSPILALAAYNAGAGAVNRWIRENGDPRKPGADPIDWIEMIPYGETRNYVQRVLEAAPVYNLRLKNGHDTSLGTLIGLDRNNGPNRIRPKLKPSDLAPIPVKEPTQMTPGGP